MAASTGGVFCGCGFVENPPIRMEAFFSRTKKHGLLFSGCLCMCHAFPDGFGSQVLHPISYVYINLGTVICLFSGHVPTTEGR